MTQVALQTAVDCLGAAGGAIGVWAPTAVGPVLTASCGALAGLRYGEWLIREPAQVPREVVAGLAVEWGEVTAASRGLSLLGATSWISHRGAYGLVFLVGPRGMAGGGWRQEALSIAAGLLGHAMERIRLGAEMEERLAERDARWASLYDIGVALTHTLDSDRLLDEVVRRAIELLHARGGALCLLDAVTGDDVVTVAYVEGAAVPQLLGYRSPPGESVAGQVIRSGEPLLLPDYVFGPTAPDTRAHRNTVLAAPLFVQGQCVGALLVGDNPLTRRFTADDIQTLVLLAQQAGAVLERSRSRAQQETLTIHRERERFARELHDGLAQNLASLLMKAELCHDLARSAGPELDGELDLLADGLQRAIRETRAAIFSLRETASSSGGVLDGLRLLAVRFEEQTRVPVTLNWSGDEKCSLTPAHHMALLGVVQEALINVRKHARATRVCVNLNAQCQNRIELSVQDDGCGFGPTRLREAAACGHFGVASMRARIEELGGTLRIESEVGRGASVAAVLPLLAIGDHRRAEDQPPPH
jgi:signal transduction histidine kinase